MKVLTFLLYFSSVFALFQDNFSSPEPKAQVPVVRLSVNFAHFHLLLQNHLANFNQIKSSSPEPLGQFQQN